MVNTSTESLEEINRRISRSESDSFQARFYRQAETKIRDNINFIDNITLAAEMFDSIQYVKFRNDMISMAVMKFGGTVETLYKSLLTAHFKDIVQNGYLVRLIDSTINSPNGRNSENVDSEYIAKKLKMFDSESKFRTMFVEKWDANSYRMLMDSGLDSLKNNRNTVAHGGELEVGNVADIISQYEKSIDVLLKLDELLDEYYE